MADIVRTSLILAAGLLAACGSRLPPGQYYACLDRRQDAGKEKPWISRVTDDVESAGPWSPERRCDDYEGLWAGACPPPESFANLREFVFSLLDALDEPHLGTDGGQTVFRLLGHDDHNVFAIRVARRGSKIWLVVKGTRRGSIQQMPPQQDIRRRVRQLSPHEWKQLEDSIRASTFWDLPPLEPVPREPPPDELVFHHLHSQVRTSIEAVSPEGHHLVYSTGPSLEKVRETFYALAGCEALVR